jgi:vitamin B12 transporter
MTFLPLPGGRARAAFLLFLAAAFASPAVHAQDETPETVPVAPVIVGATRIPTPEEQLGSSVTVITADDIAQKQERTLPEVLEDVPGLNVVQTGSPGGAAAVYIRGTNANHVKVFIDGIDASDPSTADGTFDFSQILASDIERVEVLRGPQSGLYGSDAIGGVIYIVTKNGSGPPRITASVEGGSFETFNQTAGLSGSLAQFHYSFDVEHYHSGATDVTPPYLVPPGRPLNDDYYDNKTYATKLSADVTDNFDVGLVARYVDTVLYTTSDDFIGPEAVQSANNNHELFTRGTGHLVLFDGAFDQTLGIAYSDYRRRFLDPSAYAIGFGNDPSYYEGQRIKLDYQGNVTLMPGEILTFGAEHQIDEIDDSAPVSAQMTNDAGFIQLQSSLYERFFNAISARYDDNDRFGGKPTFRDAPALLFPETGTKLKASVGTGFKAPTLDELFDNSFAAFGFFANPNLKPETSLGYDIGFEQTLFDKRVEFGATYFHNNIRNLIETALLSPLVDTYVNIGQATTYGAETYVAYRPWKFLSLRADYTYTYAYDDIAHQELLRRPKHKASFDATWHVSDEASISAEIVYTGPWMDINRDATATGLTADGYTLVNLTGSYDLGHGVTAFLRVNNLLDQHYQNPLGFQHQGLGAFGGLRIAIDTAHLPW